MARPKRFTEEMLARFETGTFERIQHVLGKDEDRADFVRAAVLAELRRRGAPEQAEDASAGSDAPD